MVYSNMYPQAGAWERGKIFYFLFHSKIFIYIVIICIIYILANNFNSEIKMIYFSFLFSLFISIISFRFKEKISQKFFSKKIIFISIIIMYFFNMALTYSFASKNITDKTFIDYSNLIMLKPILKIDYNSIDEIIKDIQSKKYIDNILKVEVKNENFIFQIVGINYQASLPNKISLSILIVFIFYLLFLIHDEQKNIVTYRKGMNFIIIGSIILVGVLVKSQSEIKLYKNMALITKKDFIGWHKILYITENHKNIYTINRRMK